MEKSWVHLFGRVHDVGGVPQSELLVFFIELQVRTEDVVFGNCFIPSMDAQSEARTLDICDLDQGGFDASATAGFLPYQLC